MDTIRVINSPSGILIKFLSPKYQNRIDILDRDCKREGIDIYPYFDTDIVNLPPKKLPDGSCQRCSWICDMSNKKVIVKQPCDCIHNKLLTIDKILDDVNSTREQKKDALLDRELLIRSNRGK